MIKDEDLIKKIQKKDGNCNDALGELVSRHSGIYCDVVNRYTASTSPNLHSLKDDLINDRNYYIYQAALKFDEKRNAKFSTYLGNEARWICLNQFNRNKSRRESNSLDVLINTFSSEDQEKELTDRDILDKIFSITKESSDKRVYKIFKSRYKTGFRNKLTPWSLVSKDVDLSIQGTINLHNKTLNTIKSILHREI